MDVAEFVQPAFGLGVIVIVGAWTAFAVLSQRTRRGDSAQWEARMGRLANASALLTCVGFAILLGGNLCSLWLNEVAPDRSVYLIALAANLFAVVLAGVSARAALRYYGRRMIDKWQS
jgi:hypothetical protein